MDEYNILRKKKNKKSGFATTALLSSLAVILLLVGLFVFLLGKVNKKDGSIVAANDKTSSNTQEVTKENGNVTCNDKGECTIIGCNSKEQIFNDNLRTIKDAAVSYFTNERLPEKIGEVKKLTLKQMQDKKLVLNLVDSNKKVCSTSDSYVEITKEKNEYVLKIFLSCSDMQDYVLVHLGCYDYCKDHVCEKEVEPGVTEFEYEYKKTTACKLSNWSSWGEWKTQREKTSNLKKEDIKVEKEQKTFTEIIDATANPATYSCAKYGDEYELDGKKCIKTVVTKEVIDAIKGEASYNCDKYDGYTLNGKVCEKEIKTTEEIDAVKGEDVYTCDDGFTLVGTKCEKEVTRVDTKPAIEKEATYTCIDGYTLDENSKTCYRFVTKTDVKEATLGCHDGYVLSNNQCVKTFNDLETIPGTTTEGYYTCPNGYDQNGTKCTRSVPKDETTDMIPTCDGDYKLVNGMCIGVYEDTEYTDKVPQYGTRPVTRYESCYKPECTTKLVLDCSSGSCETIEQRSCTEKLTTCEVVEQERFISGYTCPYGFDEYGSGCSKVVQKKDSKTPRYTCPDGYSKNNNTCTKTGSDIETIDATYVNGTHSCPNGYTDNGVNCTRINPRVDTIAPTKTCLDGYTLNNIDQCVGKTQEKETVDATKGSKEYECESGYVLNSENKCEKTFSDKEIVDAVKDVNKYSCPEGYTIDGKKCFKTNVTIDKVDATKVDGGYTCQEGYSLNSDNKCEKQITDVDVRDAIKEETTYSCPEGYTKEDTKCTRVITDLIEVTYYRYATRTCDGGGTDIKWSYKDDKSLLDNGYKLTGKKREISIEK